MRRVVSLIVAMLLCLLLACPAVAARNDYAPSISYKEGPEIRTAELKGEDVFDCLVITSVQKAQDKTTDITQEARDTLLEVYQKIANGTMKLPMKSGYEIRELVDVNFDQLACVDTDHGHKEDLEKAGTTITVKFNLGIKKNTNIQVFTYADGVWEEAKSVRNNGDGTVTGEFEHFCPVAFCVEEDSPAWQAPPKTEDLAGQQLTLWIGLMAASVVALVVAVVVYRRKSR